MYHFCYTQNAVSLLKQEYKEGELALEEALSLSVKVLSKTLDLTKLTPDKGSRSFLLSSTCLLPWFP